MSKSIRQLSPRIRFIFFSAAVLLAVAGMAAQMFFARRVQAISTTVVISQVYGGGGNSGAQYQNDFVELFNRGTSTVSLAGWSVEYTSAAGTGNFSANSAVLSGSIAPGQYYLVKLASNAAVGAPLPTADATNTSINMSGTAGKVIVANTTSIACNGSSTPCTAAQLAQIVDLVGYGSANFFEGAAAPALTNTTAAIRANSGCTDTDSNSSDFSAGAPNPRNTASPINNCGGTGSTNPSGTGSASPGSVFPGDSTTLTVNVTPGTNPASTSLTVTADLSSIGGSASQAFSGSGNTFTFNATVANATIPGVKTLPFTITDAQSRSGSGSITLTVKTAPPPNNVVISQVYGGGGNTGATLKNDYIELINHSNAPVNLSGWSVQAFVSTTGTWQMTPLTNVTLQPGQYYLIQEAAQGGGTEDLPTPDAMGSIPVSSTSTKVALVNNVTLITAACPDAGTAGIVDLVGYGPTDCFEGSGTAPTLTNTTAALRRNDGCFDTNDNANDFVSGDPSPRNTASPFHDCTALSGHGSANPSSVLQGDSTTLSVYVAPAQNPTSTGITVTADLSSIGGSASQAFVAGPNNVFSYTTMIPANQTTGVKTLPATITDAQFRATNTNIVLTVLPLVADHLTISQVYGGGGNSGATYRNDYVELYNPTAADIDTGGWTIQYASATGTTWQAQPLGGVVHPGEYYLIQLASGGAIGALLPTPNVIGSINMSATTGKVALSSGGDELTNCPFGDPSVVDLVGYGTADCHEGPTNAPAPSNTSAVFRKNNGALDTNVNGSDFVAGAPNPRRTTPIQEIGPYVLSVDPRANSTSGPHDASITVNFTEAVDVVGSWYNINCANTGLHNDATVAHTGDFKTYAITPNTNFQFSEPCTVTIFASAVHDQDTDDSAPGTDTLKADYIWSFTVVGAGQAAPYPPSVHLTMGDPGCGTPIGCAMASTSQPNNFLMEKPTYALSYNRDKGTPNWVSWHLEPAWYGSLARVDTFRPDPAIDPSWYRVQAFDYAGSGFDRGHMTPNADRDNQFRVPINQETYLMSNMVPQSPDNNQGPWAALEGDLRTIADAGNELYIVSGPLGVGGTGSNGGTTNTLAGGNITVPAFTWKVALVLPKADGDDTARVTCSTRTIAVLMPNQQGIRSNPWQNYLTTVDNIEQQTGYDFYSNLPAGIQRCIQAGVNGVNPPGTTDQSAGTPEDTPVTITLRGFQANNNALTFSITGGPTSGSLGTIGSTSCANGICTANVTYSPNADFNGPDTFTFKVNDGTRDSAASTFTLNVSEVNDPPSAADDIKSTQEDTPLTFAASDLTANDSTGPANESGQLLTVTSVTGDADTHGTVALDSGMVTYTPASDFNGLASFTYTVCDDGTTNGSPDSKCAMATVHLTVDPVNDAPTANSQSVSTDEDSSVSITLTGSDLETAPANLQFNVTQGPSHGTLSGTAPNLSYSPAANYNGPDTIKFTVTDMGEGSSAALTSGEATVSITVTPVNDAPIANGQTVATNANTALLINLTGSDFETPSGALTFAVSSGPSHGSLSGSGANLTYAPALNYGGPDSFTFTVTDTGDGSSPALTSAQATVSIFVNDTVAPTITLNGNSISLWPVNKSLHTINVADLVAGASDNFDPNVTLSSVVIASVSSDEGSAANGDIVIGSNCKSVQLRATRNGSGDGRVYTITFRVRDAAGNTGFATAKVTVPHDQGNGSNAVDSGPAYSVNSSCP